MFARLRSLSFSIRASYWFYPALFSVLAALLAVALVHVDRLGLATEWLKGLAMVDLAQPDSASNMLTVIAGSMIGVASTVFSITIAAVAYASGTYGPRLLTNFMEDRGNQLSLATFIGTFVYALMVLRTVRAADETGPLAEMLEGGSRSVAGFVPQLALIVGFGLMVASIVVLVYFLHHIPSSIRINTVLESIGQRLLHKIRDTFTEPNEGPMLPRDRPQGAAVMAHETGYIRVIDYGQLVDIAESANTEIGLAVRTGDFVHPGVMLVRLGKEGVDDDVARDVRGCFVTGGSRTPEQDIEFSVDELVEIALRALSPGINDPFTAITAIHWLGAATAKLGERDLRRRIRHEPPEECRVVPLDNDFAHFVDRGFGAARSALADNRLAALVALDALAGAAATIDDASRRALLVRETDLLLAQAELSLDGPDLSEVKARHVSVKRKLAG